MSVVNALSKNLEVWIRRDGKEYNMSFANGNRRSKLEVVGKVGKGNTGTTVRFWPDPKYFDSPQFSLSKLKHVLRAKAVLCPGLEVTLEVEKPKEKERWVYTDGLEQYLKEAVGGGDWLPEPPFSGKLEGKREAVEWALRLAPRRRRGRARELREPDPDAAGRHARERPALRPTATRCASSASSAVSCRAASSSRPRTCGKA